MNESMYFLLKMVIFQWFIQLIEQPVFLYGSSNGG